MGIFNSQYAANPQNLGQSATLPDITPDLQVPSASPTALGAKNPALALGAGLVDFGADVTKTADLAASVPFTLADDVASIFGKPTTALEDWWFANTTNYINRLQETYLTPGNSDAGTASKLIYNLASSLPYAALGPEAGALAAGVGSGMDVINQGGTVSQAVGVGAVNAGLMKLGFKLPASIGGSALTRMASGAVINTGLGAAGNVEDYGITGNSDYLPSVSGTVVNAAMGAAFGGYGALRAHLADQANKVRQSITEPEEVTIPQEVSPDKIPEAPEKSVNDYATSGPSENPEVNKIFWNATPQEREDLVHAGSVSHLATADDPTVLDNGQTDYMELGAQAEPEALGAQASGEGLNAKLKAINQINANEPVEVHDQLAVDGPMMRGLTNRLLNNYTEDQALRAKLSAQDYAQAYAQGLTGAPTYDDYIASQTHDVKPVLDEMRTPETVGDDQFAEVWRKALDDADNIGDVQIAADRERLNAINEDIIPDKTERLQAVKDALHDMVGLDTGEPATTTQKDLDHLVDVVGEGTLGPENNLDESDGATILDTLKDMNSASTMARVAKKLYNDVAQCAIS
jgi:hypothetical protein